MPTLLQTFEQELRRVRAPVADLLGPGLSPEQVAALTYEHLPEYRHEIPAEALAWWGWHNGIDNAVLERLRATAADVKGPGTDFLTPSAIRLTTLDVVLADFHHRLDVSYRLKRPSLPETQRQRLLAAVERIETAPYYPIGRSWTADSFAIRLVDDSGWTVWWMSKDSSTWYPVGQYSLDVPAPTLEQWIQDLIDGLRTKRIVVDDHGRIKSADGSEYP